MARIHRVKRARKEWTCQEMADECETWANSVEVIDFDSDVNDENWQDAIETLASEIENVASDVPSY